MSGTLGYYAREHWARKTMRRDVEEGLGPLMAANLKEVRKLPREAKEVVIDVEPAHKNIKFQNLD